MKLRRVFAILYARLFGRPLALCDIGDVDGIVSAALFLRRYPNGVVVFAAPNEVLRSWLIRSTRWTFVADLPCPGRAYVRADHHKTNTPCAEVEFYDPEAPCAALMAMKALGLENDDVARALVKIAIETDTANIVSEEAEKLDLAVRFARYHEKLYIARKLAHEGLLALNDMKIREIIERGLKAKDLMLQIANMIPIREILVIYSPKRLDISYRQLTIELQKRGAKMINILVRLGFNKYRYYCGADRDSPYDCTAIATKLGGGGHKYAAGALVKSAIFKPKEGITRFLNAIKEYLRVDKLEVVELTCEGVRSWSVG